MEKIRRKISYSQITLLAFIAIILLGAGLLLLPVSTRPGLTTAPIDAIFTATSATCVTGLVVHDTYTHWTLFGQAVILLLIQVGGLGFMAVATLFSLAMRRRIGLWERGLIQETANTTQLGGMVKLMRYVLSGTLLFEGIGAVLLSFRFVPLLGWTQGIWYGVFHSVSAFCNAGFDLMGQFEPYSSLTMFRSDPLVNLAVMPLIVIGGLGFSVWEDLLRNQVRFQKYRLHTKLVLTATVFLIFVPALVFFLVEWNGAMEGQRLGERVFASLFQSVTFRTAGFNTVDLSQLHDTSVLLSAFLMLVGGSPGSTAGGIKTTTFMVLVLAVVSMVRIRPAVSGFGRRLEDGIVRRAFSIFAIYLAVILLVACGVGLADGVQLKECLFEVFSAAGTVGCSMGVTPELGTVSKSLLCALMLFGRIGGLSMAVAFAQPLVAPPVMLPVEKISVG